MIDGIRRLLAGVMVFLLLCVITGAAGFPWTASVDADDTPLPDLVIETLSGPPTAPVIGTTTTFSATIGNRGNAASAPCRLDFSIGEIILDSLYVDGIPAGESITCILTWKAEAGNHVLTATADSTHVVVESNETNNTMTLAFSVLAADLVIRGITWEPQTISAGDMVTFTVSISNQGNQSSRYGEYEFFINDVSRGRFSVPVLAPTASIERTVSWIAQPGSFIIRADLDVWNSTKEVSETNNSYCMEFTTAGPDLIISGITWTPLERTDSENITLSMVVKNQGTGTSRAAWLTYFTDDSAAGRVMVAPLSANTSRTYTYSWNPGSENCTFGAVIDLAEEVWETDETNNSLYVQIPAVGITDLILSSLTCSPAVPLIGHPAAITVTVKNDGNRTVSNVDLKLYTSYNFNLVHYFPSISAGGTATHTFKVTALDRTLNVSGVIDEAGIVRESNETNNRKSITLVPRHPAPEADMVVESISLQPQARIGQETIIYAIIKNAGKGTTIGSHAAFYLDGKKIDVRIVNSLNAGGTYTVTLPWEATAGKHTLAVRADFYEDIRETDETNNETSIEFTTLAPDLVVKNLIWSPETPQLGDTVTLIAVIENRGNDASGETEVEYYVNGLARGQHYVNPLEPGETVIRTFTWQAQVIPDSFGAFVDKADIVLESNELNNNKLAPLPAPDIGIQDIEMSPVPAEAGSTVSLTVTLANKADGKAGITRISASVNGTPLPPEANNVLLPGGSQEITFTWRGDPGYYKFTVTADETDYLVESNESNNTASLLFPVIEPLPPASDNTTGISSANGTGGLLGGVPSLILPDTEPQAETLPVELFEQPEDEAEELPELNEPPSEPWWKIFTSLWFLIGVSVLGVAAIGVLLFLRRRLAAQGAGPAEAEAKEPEPPQEES